LLVMSRFLFVLGFDVNFLLMINHFGGFWYLFHVNLFLWELLHDGQSCGFLFIVFLFLRRQFLLLLIYIQLAVLFLLDHLHIHGCFFNSFFSSLLAEILDDCQSGPSLIILVHRFETFINMLGLLLHV